MHEYYMNEKTEIFINKARKIHGSKYSYTDVVYSLANTPVPITCSKHGNFMQRPVVHLRGSGCTKCLHESMHLNTDDVIQRYARVHNNRYDYSDTVYVNSSTKILIKCKVHGDFSQNPKDHENGSGCPQCSYVDKGNAGARKYLRLC
jgi:hypothetical protein